MLQDEVEASLRAEVARLSSELQEAEEEKLQAARYGLAVLEESGALKQKYADLETEHEGLRLELEHLKEALADSVSNHKKVTVDGENREESLLRETASREAALEERIEELQNELKQSRASQNSTQSENERCSTLSHHLNKECERLEAERGQLQEDIKEYKIRELRQLQDNTELEEENISLQKQVSVLKENQVEFEAVKHELKRHSEELELLNAQLEEQARLREISERQLEEALEELKQEREQKNSLRRELASYSLNPFDSLCNLQQHLEELGLDASLPGEKEEEGEGDSGFNNGALVNKVFRPAPSLVSDLLSELNLSETQRLRQQLLQTERDKAGLSGLVQELQRQVENTKGALVEQQGKTHKLAEQVEALQGCKELLLQHGEHGKEHCTGSGESGQDEYYELDLNGEDILESRFRAANGELTRLRKDLKEAGAKYSALESKCKQEKDRWRGEAQELAEKIRQCIKSSRQDQERISELEKEIGATRKVATDSEGSLSMAQDELVAFSEELAYLYHHICTCSNVTPNRVMLDYYREGRGSRNPLRKRRSSDLYAKSLLNLDSPVAESGSSGEASPVGGSPNSPTLDFRDPSNLKSLIAVVRRQIKHLQECERLEAERGQLQEDIKEYKIRELRQLQDNTELEEENISLQKQVSVLKENQVEFEAVKHELKRHSEELELLNAQLEEQARLREISERQLEEALEELKQEREQKNSLRRELASYSLNPFDSLCNLQQHLEELGLDASLPGEKEEEGEGDSGFNNGALVNKVFRPAPSLVSDLLSELNLSETQRLRQQLLQTEREKAGLSGLVQELQRQVENTKGALVEQQGKTHKLAEQVEALQGCKELLLQHGEHGKEHCTGSGESGQDEYYELDLNGEDILESRFRAANGELTRLRKDLKEAGAKYSALESKCKQEKDRWRGEAQELAEKIRQCIKSSRQDQERISELEKEIGATRKVATDSEGSLSMAQDELVAFSEELAYLYHHICMCSNVTPNRVMLDYYREGRGSRNPLRKRRSSDLYAKSLLNLDSPVAESGSSGEASPVGGTPNSPTLDFRDPSNVKNLIAVVRSQIKHLQVAVELSRRRGTLPASSSSPEAERDGEALLEEVLKLKSQLSTKREQIATLRTVLKANKQTAEVTLSNLKSKYESEKALVSETMVKLRNELKALKEDSATFSSMRSMFANRCDQYVTQLDQMQRQLAAAEDEKKTLNSLLRMAIQQKLGLTQRLEELETPHPGASPRRSRGKPVRSSRSPRASPVRSYPSPQASPVRSYRSPRASPRCAVIRFFLAIA
ncbi:UNVERIFIED_CONTAM: hypothetical protein FKN15_040913 [Acipenser sinensis]